ncbi:ECF transporter S component [Clostridium aestuarii]|uniref:ECF transporter S component n=1 Tax=Clostridium aestuarii TaxID=338193 RepID=A0ABT4CYL0_9CLOT|nr:ECF transporter S component [Clostridium aestuarii]MCY6483215.1 ECF transporter S component [Clostridium aestuarii]
MENKHKGLRMSSTKINSIVQVGLMASIICVATFIVHIPSFMGVVHLGDSMIFLAAVLLGRKKSAMASAIGMSLFDVLSGYVYWAPFTFIIKGLMAFIAASIVYRKKYEGENVWNNLLAFSIAGIFMIIAYYFSGAVLARFVFAKTATLNQAFILALKDVPGNISQALAGIIIGVPLSLTVKKALERSNISI